MANTYYFRTIRPSKKMKASVFNNEVKTELQKVADGILKDFAKTTRTWTHKPKFKKKVRSTGQPKKVEVWTSDKIYKYVNDGTKKHVIRPKKKGGVLVFPAKSTPKTTPMLISSKKGSRGKKLIFAKEVQHPGTKARKFDKVISKKWKPRFYKALQKAYRTAARKSGFHSTRRIP